MNLNSLQFRWNFQQFYFVKQRFAFNRNCSKRFPVDTNLWYSYNAQKRTCMSWKPIYPNISEFSNPIFYIFKFYLKHKKFFDIWLRGLCQKLISTVPNCLFSNKFWTNKIGSEFLGKTLTKIFTFLQITKETTISIFVRYQYEFALIAF